MEADPRDEESGADEGDGQQGDGGREKPWYPYITKTQFEKFISRLQSRVPDEVDRDYVRAIIRTPSMIYRFLRGIEAMGLIDRDQRPTNRLRSLVDRETRRQALGEVVRDLYPELLAKYVAAGGEMADREVVAFFRKETGMGNDSANKMKMFFKYLLSEADVDGISVVTTDDDLDEEAEDEGDDEEGIPAADNGRSAEARGAVAERRAPPPQPQPAPARQGGTERGERERGGDRERADRGSERPERQERPDRDRGDRGRGDRGDRGDRERGERGERGERDRFERGDRDRPERAATNERAAADRGGNDRGTADRGGDDRGLAYSNRPLTEAQRAYLDTLKSVLRVNVDGDWDDDMIRLAFDRLERLFDRIRRG